MAESRKQSAEHTAKIQASRLKVLRAKKKLGLKWKDPLPEGHPLLAKKKSGYDPARAKRYRERSKARKAATAGGDKGPAQSKAEANRLYRARRKARESNGANGATHAKLEDALASTEGGMSFPLDIIPERKARGSYAKKPTPHVSASPPGQERLAKLQLAAALVMAINRILE